MERELGEDLSEASDEAEALIERAVFLMRDIGERAAAEDWDRIEATGPPEPTPPWTFGGFSR